MMILMVEDGCIVVLCTTPSKAEATNIAKSLVSKKLAACVNIIESVHSIFMWDKELQEEKEHLMIIKTTKEQFEKLKVEIMALHSYEVPEIIALPIIEGSNSYLEWLRDGCASK